MYHYVECCYAECHYAECCYAEYPDLAGHPNKVPFSNSPINFSRKLAWQRIIKRFFETGILFYFVLSTKNRRYELYPNDIIPNDIIIKITNLRGGSGSVKAIGRDPKSCLGRVFNFKLGCFVTCTIAWPIHARPSLELKTRPRFSLVILSLPMGGYAMRCAGALP